MVIIDVQPLADTSTSHDRLVCAHIARVATFDAVRTQRHIALCRALAASFHDPHCITPL